jgi:hypothetical protein
MQNGVFLEVPSHRYVMSWGPSDGKISAVLTLLWANGYVCVEYLG